MPRNSLTLMMNSPCSQRVDCCNCLTVTGCNSHRFDYWRQGQCSHSPLVQEVVLVLHWSLDPEPGAQHMLDGEWNMPAGGRCRGSPPFQPPRTWGRRGAWPARWMRWGWQSGWGWLSGCCWRRRVFWTAPRVTSPLRLVWQSTSHMKKRENSSLRLVAQVRLGKSAPDPTDLLKALPTGLLRRCMCREPCSAVDGESHSGMWGNLDPTRRRVRTSLLERDQLIRTIIALWFWISI